MTDPFRPVILGTDLGVYSMARSFHEACGVRSLVVSNSPRGPINDSRILDQVLVGRGATQEQTLEVLDRLPEQHSGSRLLLMVNSEHELGMIRAHRERLARGYVLPYPPNEVLARGQDKAALAAVCQQLGVASPRTVGIALESLATGSAGLEHAAELRLPVVVKMAEAGDYLLRNFPGQRKVYAAQDRAELERILRLLVAQGVTGEVLVQELIPGDDTASRVVTCYRDRAGRITAMASGQVLLGLHSPMLVGNGAAILTEPQPELETQAAAILEALDYRGLANFDFRVDPRNGVAHVLDLNTRIGRSHYYANVAGVNPVRALVADYAEELGYAEDLPREEARAVGLYSYVPWTLLRRYLEPGLLDRVKVARRRRGLVHPLAYAADRHPRRLAYRVAAAANLRRDFRRHYPAPTPTSF
ncbi:carboxylate--amine ligase [Bogoriella caseilytica]|uniref:carboxylate--amine ligase n=1 Tax=Bogoriella caseilytica TaxID=56055 RepID=UPI000F469BFB|nr:carboxylate--amine ligase [Bogoriella caseilytica]